mmetsp:Transcript_71404/g.185366  ORF Transcript_71404/g.185366 Transcript_71404/m.185366 type:complete len:281 (+) Transcript_71404:79-921(+)
MAAVQTEVKGMGEAMKQAEAGMALFAKDTQEEAKLDVPSAEAFKQEQEAAMKAKEEEANALTGKENKKARTEISKQVAAMKVDPKYIDACKVVKGLAPPSGNFQFAGAPKKLDAKAAPAESAPAAAEAAEGAQDSKKAKDAKPKKVESAGLSKAERDELEKLKVDIISRKSELKAAGKTGGECNKDEQVVAWVARMNELKIKEDPSLAAAGKDGKDAGKAKKKGGNLSSAQQATLEKMKADLEEYRLQLVKEFGYSKKDIEADPDYVDKKKAIQAMEGGK